ncbi:MAG: hypothetical protein WAL36_10665 [Pseudolabrys sp.]|jgi:hypothetical protein
MVGASGVGLTKLWNCHRATADDLSAFGPDTIDLLIYGWCLYLCDREDLFKIVTEGDRILKDSGYLVVYDFHAAARHPGGGDSSV